MSVTLVSVAVVLSGTVIGGAQPLERDQTARGGTSYEFVSTVGAAVATTPEDPAAWRTRAETTFVVSRSAGLMPNRSLAPLRVPELRRPNLAPLLLDRPDLVRD
ncbi:MAG: hypothetical protein KGM43_05615 [Planctomycetota bacterium]|nr:hypothetical protein [Planctomycetota bacterium]